MNKDPVILSYEDSLLRESDVSLLHGPHWLNDNIISFYFEYLKNTFEEAPYLLFVPPEVTQCIKITPTSQIAVFLEPLKAREKNFIFFALNDNDRPQYAGGTHWSLLVYSRLEEVFYHFDSSRGVNRGQAENFAKKFFAYLNIQGSVREVNSLQQSNGFDCGIHLISNAEVLARHLCKSGKVQGFPANSDVMLNHVLNMRTNIIGVIDKLRGLK